MKVSQYTSPINLRLQFDYIYYFPSIINEELNSEMEESATEWQCSLLSETILFKFYPKIKFCCVPKEAMSALFYNLNEDNDKGEYSRTVLERMLGSKDGGVLIARLLSRNSSSDEEAVELLVASNLDLAWESTREMLDNFAMEVAKDNFERITETSFDEYKQKQAISVHATLEPSMDFTTYDSRKFQQESRYQRDVEQMLREKASKLSSMSESKPLEEIMQYVKELEMEIEDGKKLLKMHKVVVEYSTDTLQPEIFVIIDKNYRIRCEFERGIIGKVFYIFFLKHATGWTLSDLSKCLDELLKIDEKFQVGERNDRRAQIENMLDKDIMTQYRSHVKGTFKNIFGSAILPNYCININNSLMSIPLDRKYVELGEFK